METDDGVRIVEALLAEALGRDNSGPAPQELEDFAGAGRAVEILAIEIAETRELVGRPHLTMRSVRAVQDALLDEGFEAHDVGVVVDALACRIAVDETLADLVPGSVEVAIIGIGSAINGRTAQDLAGSDEVAADAIHVVEAALDSLASRGIHVAFARGETCAWEITPFGTEIHRRLVQARESSAPAPVYQVF